MSSSFLPHHAPSFCFGHSRDVVFEKGSETRRRAFSLSFRRGLSLSLSNWTAPRNSLSLSSCLGDFLRQKPRNRRGVSTRHQSVSLCESRVSGTAAETLRVHSKGPPRRSLRGGLVCTSWSSLLSSGHGASESAPRACPPTRRCSICQGHILFSRCILREWSEDWFRFFLNFETQVLSRSPEHSLQSVSIGDSGNARVVCKNNTTRIDAAGRR